VVADVISILVKETLKQKVLVSLLTTTATAVANKGVEYFFDRLKAKNAKEEVKNQTQNPKPKTKKPKKAKSPR
jgi:hypothetical protein